MVNKMKKKIKFTFKAEDTKHILGDEYFLYDSNRDQWEDKYNKLKAKVVKFVKEHYEFIDADYENAVLSDQGSPTFMVEYHHKGLKQMVWISWDMKDPSVIDAYKTKMINDFTPFYPEELRFLDGLDIDLYDKFTEEMKQSVTDWYGEM
jgi:hypothetical protein